MFCTKRIKLLLLPKIFMECDWIFLRSYSITNTMVENLFRRQMNETTSQRVILHYNVQVDHIFKKCFSNSYDAMNFAQHFEWHSRFKYQRRKLWKKTQTSFLNHIIQLLIKYKIWQRKISNCSRISRREFTFRN